LDNEEGTNQEELR